MKKCHNCNYGMVDGGSKKRIDSEAKILMDDRDKKVSQIHEKEPKKRNDLINNINKEFNPKIKKKENEAPFKSECLYCNGSGLRR